METRRREASSRLRRAAPTATGLADVVRRAGHLPAKPVVRQLLHPAAARITQGPGIDGEESIPRKTAAPHPRLPLQLSLYRSRGTAAHRRVVAARTVGRISSANLVARKRRATST